MDQLYKQKLKWSKIKKNKKTLQYETNYILSRDIYAYKKTRKWLSVYLEVGWKGCELEGAYWGLLGAR